MKETPLVFRTPLVRALLTGIKTQLRLPVKWKRPDKGLNLAFSGLSAGCYMSDLPKTGYVLRSRDGSGCWNDRTKPTFCPLGAVGDRLWVREQWRPTGTGAAYYASTDKAAAREGNRSGWRFANTLPREASRILLEITALHVQPLLSLTTEDAQAEGIEAWMEYLREQRTYNHNARLAAYPVTAFLRYWDSCHGKRALSDSNPWVWAITFRRLESVTPS